MNTIERIKNISVSFSKIPMYVGCETELANISTRSLSDIISKLNYSGWKCDADDSIKVTQLLWCAICKKNHIYVGDRYGAEAVSPKTATCGIDTMLKQFAKTMVLAVKNGAVTNETCGTHVHIDASNMSELDAYQTLYCYAMIEDVAYKYFLGDGTEPRVNYVDLHNFAKSIKPLLIDGKYEPGSEKMFSSDQRYRKYWGWYVSTQDHSGNPRRTIEYRLFNATTDMLKLKEMIAFSIAITYLGKLGFEAEAPDFFDPKKPINENKLLLLKAIIELGYKILLEVKSD